MRNEDGRASHASIFSDISVLRAAEERMRQLANYDPPTPVCPTARFGTTGGTNITKLRRNNSYGSLMVIDLYRFTIDQRYAGQKGGG
ncbi:MAG: hypothetical protein IPH35_18360 [Rhodoferax sp.]|nr:hypothetical protein [Rhodoferax sp.]